MNEEKEKLIIRFGKYMEHLEFLGSDEGLEKYGEFRYSLYNIWEYKTNKLEAELVLLG